MRIVGRRPAVFRWLASPPNKTRIYVAIVSPGRKISCRVRVHESYAAKARYALAALLAPLGLDPVYEGEPRIIYGGGEEVGYPSSAFDAGPERRAGSDAEPCERGVRSIRLAFAPNAENFYARRRPFRAAEASAYTIDGENWPVPFLAGDGSPDFIASAFLFLSGWQEAASDDRDAHGRVPFAGTVPGLLHTADRPVVDAYRHAIASQLSRAGIDVQPRRWSGRTWALCPTHDIDYIRKWRPGIVYREVVQDFMLNRRSRPLSGRIGRFLRTLRQMSGGDPYRRAFLRMIEEVARRGGTATYFIKAGAGDPHDVRYSLAGSFMQSRFHDLKERGYEIALHPSYSAVVEPDRLRTERDKLAAAASTDLVSVRQHYLRFDPTRTPLMHADAGFQIDSTVGFSDHSGFRRGTCLPHKAYDLDGDAVLDVWEMPLVIMESALFNRQGLPLKEAVDETERLLDLCRRFGGACVVLWHNTLWDEIDCPGWGQHFTTTLDAAVERNATIASLASALRGWR